LAPIFFWPGFGGNKFSRLADTAAAATVFNLPWNQMQIGLAGCKYILWISSLAPKLPSLVYNFSEEGWQT
jgi:hypothetical protein